jgi:hypothetical protein
VILGKRRRDPAWYADWREEAFQELGDKQDRLEEKYGLGQWPRYDYDLETTRLTFSDEHGPKVACEVQVVGTVGDADWLWGWANAHLPTSCTKDVLQVKSYGQEHGIDELACSHLKAKDLQGLGWMLTAVAARLLGADGAYRTPNGLFMICRSIRFLS